MAPIVTTVQVDRPADEVFAYATDPTRFKEWQQGVVDGHLETHGTPTVGTRCLTTRRIGGADRPAVSEVSHTRYDTSRRRWRQLDFGACQVWLEADIHRVRAPEILALSVHTRPAAGTGHDPNADAVGTTRVAISPRLGYTGPPTANPPPFPADCSVAAPNGPSGACLKSPVTSNTRLGCHSGRTCADGG